MSSPPVAVTAERLLSPSRYRHPGDVIRLISAGLLLAISLVVSWAARRWLLGTSCALLAALVVNWLQRPRGANRPRRSAHPPVSDPARPADRR